MLKINLAEAFFCIALLFAALFPLAMGNFSSEQSLSNGSVEWAESEWLPKDAYLQRQPLTTIEQRFAMQFPGHIARFTDGQGVWIVRVIDRPTRMLHPAVDCFRGTGYKVEPPHVKTDQRNKQWRCFSAMKNGQRLKVCERIFDTKDNNWTDTSSWYWSALMASKDNNHGQWWAITKVEAGT